MRNEAITPEELKAILPTLPWRFAWTMAHMPHWYVLRAAEIEDVYVALFHACNTLGVWGRFGKQGYHYWYPGDGWKYWTMTRNLKMSSLINTARPDGSYTPGDGRPENPKKPPGGGGKKLPPGPTSL